MGSHPGVVQSARSSSSATCKQGIRGSGAILPSPFYFSVPEALPGSSYSSVGVVVSRVRALEISHW